MPVSNNPIQDNMNAQVSVGTKDIVSEQAQKQKLDTYTTVDDDFDNEVRGLSAEELNDPNKIIVTVSDKETPLVVLFGPPSCGKTMTLVRMTRFLKSEGYTVGPIRTFRPIADTNYAEICGKFDETMNSDYAAESTKRISFMLVEVLKEGRPICQILEAPGEYYFNPKKPNAAFPSYVNTIIASPNRKIWAIMIEPDWMDHQDRLNYVSRISNLTKIMRPKDNVVFVFNKIDRTPFVMTIGNINTTSAIKHVKNLYPGIFNSFMNQNPITKWFKTYNCDFVPFQTGFYTEVENGLTYQEGPKEYCVQLWKSLMKNIFG